MLHEIYPSVEISHWNRLIEEYVRILKNQNPFVLDEIIKKNKKLYIVIWIMWVNHRICCYICVYINTVTDGVVLGYIYYVILLVQFLKSNINFLQPQVQSPTLTPTPHPILSSKKFSVSTRLHISVYSNIPVNFTLQQVTKAQRESRGIALLFL